MGSHHRLTFRPLVLGAVVALGSTLASCETSHKTAPARAMRGQNDAGHPVDRLAPGELGASSRMVFGFAVPLGMKLQSQSAREVHMSGTASLEALARYVRDRVQVSQVEFTGSRFVFNDVRIKGGDPGRKYLFELVRRHRRSLLVIRDRTPPPAVKGISEEERWRRAGLTPDGQQLDPLKLE
ncbi:MAG: hypothetical protein JW940_24395 [Polyangiaceae bacterium]|nr:hypothetical protein [Polyangiaceae bacterium]